ncbi:MAG: hypothetical protein KDB61_11060, partial [Planctomycetes bacterium]|nr:hypothetical protein [Planctomycetota bacterium]
MLCVPMATASPGPSDRSTGEGPLQNDTFVPTSKEAQTWLAAGDLSLVKARESGSESLRAEAFDSWLKALQSEGGNSWVHGAGENPLADSPWTEDSAQWNRLEFGQVTAVVQRVLRLTAAEQDSWRIRFSPLAAESLERGPFSRDVLREVERGYPLTPSAGLAALRLADLELERGAT